MTDEQLQALGQHAVAGGSDDLDSLIKEMSDPFYAAGSPQARMESLMMWLMADVEPLRLARMLAVAVERLREVEA